MQILLDIFNYIKDNGKEVCEAIAYLIAGASIIVKITPTLKDDHYLKSLIKFVGKFIALDKYGPPKPGE